MSSEQPTPLRYDQSGLRGKRAHVLVDEPTDEIDWPANLPDGIKTVVIVDDTPNPHHTLRRKALRTLKHPIKPVACDLRRDQNRAAPVLTA